MPNAQAALQVAELELRAERTALVASIASVNARIKAIDVVLEGLAHYPKGHDEQPSNGAANAGGGAQRRGNAPTHREAALAVFSASPGVPIHAKVLWERMLGLGVSSGARDPINALDGTINDLIQRGHPISRLGKRQFRYDPPNHRPPGAGLFPEGDAAGRAAL